MSSSHTGWSKWCRQTIGSSPRVAQRDDHLPVAGQGRCRRSARSPARRAPSRPTGAARSGRGRARGRSRAPRSAHQLHAMPLRFPARTWPRASQRAHVLAGLPTAPSHWNAEVATPQRKPSGNRSVPSLCPLPGQAGLSRPVRQPYSGATGGVGVSWIAAPRGSRLSERGGDDDPALVALNSGVQVVSTSRSWRTCRSTLVCVGDTTRDPSTLYENCP